jgi:hypothetical protein
MVSTASYERRVQALEDGSRPDVVQQTFVVFLNQHGNDERAAMLATFPDTDGVPPAHAKVIVVHGGVEPPACGAPDDPEAEQ